MDHITSFAANSGNLPLIEFKQVVLGTNSRETFYPAIHPVNWTIRDNEQWAVAGPTGSGKSALIDAMLKKSPLTGGRILYYFDRSTDAGKTGRPNFNKDDILRVSTSSSGLLPSGSPGFYQARWHSMQELDSPLVADYLRPETSRRMSLFEVTPAPIEPAPVQETERLMETVSSLMDIQNLLNRRIRHLSNGELRKVLIARALVQRPKLMILDEPFTGLDTRSQIKFHSILENLLASGKINILLVTARPEVIPKGITHVLHMADGRVTAGNPKNDRVLSVKVLSDIGTDLQPELHLPEPLFTPPENDSARADIPVIIDVKNASVTYDNVIILDRINWQVRKGERWALLGPNGAGKSTLLSLVLADNPQAYANDITLFGKKRGTGETIWEVKRPMGWMSPELQIYYKRDTTCLDVVCSGFFDSIGLYRSCTAQQTDIAKKWMDVLKILDLENRLFAQLSEGRQRIVLIARALVKSPKLLVLDEPCQGLDRNTRERTIRLIDQICRRMNTTLLYVTHDMNELPGVVTHALTLDNGKMTGCGPI